MLDAFNALSDSNKQLLKSNFKLTVSLGRSKWCSEHRFLILLLKVLIIQEVMVLKDTHNIIYNILTSSGLVIFMILILNILMTSSLNVLILLDVLLKN